MSTPDDPAAHAVRAVQDTETIEERDALLAWLTDNMTSERAGKVVEVLNCRPSLIWNNRLGVGYPGDTAPPEQHISLEATPGSYGRRAWP